MTEKEAVAFALRKGALEKQVMNRRNVTIKLKPDVFILLTPESFGLLRRNGIEVLSNKEK